jgi:hypothetical protein
VVVSDGDIAIRLERLPMTAVPTSVEALLAACQANGGTFTIMRDDLHEVDLSAAGACVEAIEEAWEQGLAVSTSKVDRIEVTALPIQNLA